MLIDQSKTNGPNLLADPHQRGVYGKYQRILLVTDIAVILVVCVLSHLLCYPAVLQELFI